MLEVLLDDDAEKVVEAASLARDTVDMYVQELDSLHPQDPDLEEKVLAHPLMQAELERQREDLEVLGDLERASSEAVHELSGRLRNPRLSNIGQPRIE